MGSVVCILGLGGIKEKVTICYTVKGVNFLCYILFEFPHNAEFSEEMDKKISIFSSLSFSYENSLRFLAVNIDARAALFH